MAFMEFLKQNLLNTTTMLTTTANNGVATFPYVLDRNIRLGFQSLGYNSNTAMTLSIKFPATTAVSHIFLQNHNLRDFRAYYDGVTANSLGVVSSNSATSTYLSFSTVQAAQIDLDFNLQQVSGSPASNTEKKVGEVVVTSRLAVVEVNPSVQDWQPNLRRRQIVTEMPDGGVKVFQIKDKFVASMRYHFITSTFRDTLYGLWSSANAMYFVPYPTTTGWDGRAYESVWVGDFDFTYEENSKRGGFNGTVNLRETAGG